MPSQALVVSTDDGPAQSGVDVQVHSFLPNVGFMRTGRLEGEGGRTEKARPATAPGISANNEFYVVAYWGAVSNFDPFTSPYFNSLTLFVSEKGRIFSRAGSHHIGDPRDIDDQSRPSVIFFHPTQKWFVAYRNATNGAIQLAQFGIHCIRDSRGDCEEASRVGHWSNELFKRFASAQIGNVIDTGFVCASAPTLSVLGTSLVLAFVPQGASTLSVATSTNGSIFTAPAAAASGGTAIVCNAGAPYFCQSATTLFLATAVDRPGGGGVDIRIFTSANATGTIWTAGRSVPAGTGIWSGGRVDPSIAGLAGFESDMLVAHRTDRQRGTTVHTGAGPASLASHTLSSVGMAFGPGPSYATRLTCAEPNLVARGSSGDVTIVLGYSASIPTNGDLAIRCGAASESYIGAPNDTRRVDIERSSGPDFTVMCWRK